MKTVRKKEVSYTDGVRIYLFAIVASLAVQLFISVLAMVGNVATGNEHFAEGDYFQLVSMLLLQAGFAAVPLIYYGCVMKASPVLLAPLRKPQPSVLLGIVLAVLSIAGFFLPAYWVTVGLDKIGYNFSAGVSLDTAGKFVLGLLVMVVAAPCVEELIFRGFLLSGLRRQFSPYAAAALCALAFSLMHMNPEQTVYQFCLGFVCALAAMKSGHLLTSVLVHAGSNLIALLLDTPLGRPFHRAVDRITQTPWAAVLGTVLLLAACGAAIWALCKVWKKGGKGDAEERAAGEDMPENAGMIPAPAENKKTGLAVYIGGIILCAAMWVFVFVAAVK